jgi:hypothetical protein
MILFQRNVLGVLLNAPVMWNAVAFEERRLQWATMREKLGKDPSSR